MLSFIIETVEIFYFHFDGLGIKEVTEGHFYFGPNWLIPRTEL